MEPRWLYHGETYLMRSQLKDEKKKKKVTVTVSLNKTEKNKLYGPGRYTLKKHNS